MSAPTRVMRRQPMPVDTAGFAATVAVACHRTTAERAAVMATDVRRIELECAIAMRITDGAPRTCVVPGLQDGEIDDMLANVVG